MTLQPNWSTVGSDDPVDVGPSDAEIEAWAVRERQRREQWLSGPTPEQAAVWAARERERRLGRSRRRAPPTLAGSRPRARVAAFGAQHAARRRGDDEPALSLVPEGRSRPPGAGRTRLGGGVHPVAPAEAALRRRMRFARPQGSHRRLSAPGWVMERRSARSHWHCLRSAQTLVVLLMLGPRTAAQPDSAQSP